MYKSAGSYSVAAALKLVEEITIAQRDALLTLGLLASLVGVQHPEREKTRGFPLRSARSKGSRRPRI